MNDNYVRIFDTTLRDGEQSPGYSMNLSEKLRMARQLDRLGVDIIEAGFPIASPDDFKAVQEIARVCEHATVCGLARALEKDIRCAGDAIKGAKKTRIHTFVSTSEIHLKYQIKKTEEEVLEMTKAAVSLARELCENVEFSPMDATRSNPDFMFKVLAIAIECGATTLNIPDTVGYSTPPEYGAMIRAIREQVPGADKVVISTHCHDDLGLAVANSLAGIENGARQVECTINGIGERAGNASLEEIVMALRTRQDHFGLETGIQTKEIYPTSRLLTSITGIPVQPNKAIVGANAFAHESGIHQDGVLKERTTYEIMSAQDIGMESNAIILGKHSGRHALKARLVDMGLDPTPEELNEYYEQFIALADKKKNVYDEDLMLLVGVSGSQGEYQLKDFSVEASTEKGASARIVITDPDGKDHEATATGDGPVDAAFGAVNSVISLENTLVEYRVNAVTEGIDAQATVAVQIRANGKTFSGSSSDTDIIVASVKAYIEALNRGLVGSENSKE